VEDSLKYWVALNLVLAEHLKDAKKIVDHFPTLKDAFNASSREFAALGIEKEKAQALTSSKILDRACREIEKLERKKYSILTLESENYPEYLREIFDPPFVLYCAGKIEALKGPAVSVVGARRPSAYGRAVAEKLARDLGSRGVVVVSGLARGVDSIAHWGGR
jgi:DNA processing protein